MLDWFLALPWWTQLVAVCAAALAYMAVVWVVAQFCAMSGLED